MKRNLPALTLALLLLSLTSAFAQVSSDYAVRVTATTGENPPTITLHWNYYAGTTGYYIYRKAEGGSIWGSYIAHLPNDSLQYTDTDVQVDSLYEYKVHRSDYTVQADGYLTGAIRLHSKDYKGALLLVVDSSVADTLETELLRLMKDISHDGWAVKRVDVSPADSVPNVKALIAAEYNTSDLKAVLLFGHVPVPYSGTLNPDGHPDHYGAWPADVYYAEMNSGWTDEYDSVNTASRIENWNVPGDGKFDATYLPSKVELQIGRVDLHNLPSFNTAETELLRQYLNKDHDYRVGNFTVPYRGLVDDNFGAFGGEAFASCGFRNFAPLMGDSSIDEVDYFTTLTQQPHLWSYGCGGGWYTGAGGVGSTTDFVNDTVKTVFTMLFGSYFGDWDSQDNFLRAPLASRGYALTNCWAGRPYWFFHYMGLGENIGYCARLTQNNSSLYPGNYGTFWVHVALMGDPTLRMYVIKPPANVVLDSVLPNLVSIQWNASPDTVLGYNVYRSLEEFGKYERANDSIITATSFTDSPDSSGNYYYMVRAVRLEETPSGTFYNLSEGADAGPVNVFVTGVNEVQHPFEFSLYPNPATDRLIVLFEGKNHSSEVTISNMEGHELKSFVTNYSSHLIMNISSLAPGMYLINVDGVVKKFVKM